MIMNDYLPIQAGLARIYRIVEGQVTTATVTTGLVA